MTDAKEIRDQYVNELRNILPWLQDWWDGVQTELSPEIAWRRWPTGPAGHPRVLAVFRKYYLQIEASNNSVEETPPAQKQSEQWGTDDHGEDQLSERPLDWLIFDIAAIAPDLKDLVDGLCFIPVGIDDEEEVV
ncbi:MAG: hypothetical protein EOQ39_12565 [Mesorhizobium sp.]|uniref:hypothetical protein n=1 Tax=Mesorhizobium sp. TaxID=1871066 RepID=UPI000FEA0FD2|nr:hypothetical protein [Mesorhizobium sp.]RWB10038.1 MAG: hypothetical protein EOQ37_02470 [Mesorhizobium sp.]RWB15245.1 MAG: hypothetical protein EOQ39_12565 [Mesorhizobium sp.]